MTNKSEAITIVKTTTLAEAKEYAEIFMESDLFKDTKELAKAKVKIIAGSEMGLKPFESMSGLDIIQGNITLSGNIQAAKIKENPRYDYKIVQSDSTICEIDFYEYGKKTGTSIYTFEEAKNITFWDKKNGKNKSLTEKDTWKNYPSDMLFNRCISRGRKRYSPDVFGGIKVYDPEELNESEPINITPKESSKQPEVDKPLKSFKQCTKCGNSIPKDNESDLCAKCIGNKPVDVDFEDVPEKPKSKTERKAEVEEFETEIQGVPDEVSTPILEDMDNEAKPIIPASIIDGIEKPRDALENILEYAMRVEKGRDVKTVVIEHYKAWETGEPSLCNIPETNIIRIVEGLTGVKMKKKEKTHKCDCGKRITEAELEERDGFCMACWKKMEADD